MYDGWIDSSKTVVLLELPVMLGFTKIIITSECSTHVGCEKLIQLSRVKLS